MASCKRATSAIDVMSWVTRAVAMVLMERRDDADAADENQGQGHHAADGRQHAKTDGEAPHQGSKLLSYSGCHFVYVSRRNSSGDVMSKLVKKRTVKITALTTILLMIGITSCSKETTESLISEARQYQTKGDDKSAIIQLKNALQNTPDNAQARYLLGTIYNQTGDSASAEKELRRALQLGTSPAEVLPELTNALLAQGKFQQALDETKLIAGEQMSARVSALRGNAYLALGKGQEARTSFEQALKKDPGHPQALIGLSKVALTEKNIESATDYSVRVFIPATRVNIEYVDSEELETTGTQGLEHFRRDTGAWRFRRKRHGRQD